MRVVKETASDTRYSATPAISSGFGMLINVIFTTNTSEGVDQRGAAAIHTFFEMSDNVGHTAAPELHHP